MKMAQRKKQIESSQQSNETDLADRLHPSLQTVFEPLPKATESLTDEQLAAIFSGDLKALRDIVRLVQWPVEDQSDQ